MSDIPEQSEKAKERKGFDLIKGVSVLAILLLMATLAFYFLPSKSGEKKINEFSKDKDKVIQSEVRDQSNMSKSKNELDEVKNIDKTIKNSSQPKSSFKLKLVKKPDNNILFRNDLSQLENLLNDELKINAYKNSGRPRVKSFTLSIELDQNKSIKKIKIYKSNESNLDLVVEKIFRSITNWEIINEEKTATGEYKIFLH